ncbi:MAG TPA: DUF362 domain-containing protein [Nitrospinota bacterium]|nr:DUF362 domain-containing protein [Nitrospinota bacterium]
MPEEKIVLKKCEDYKFFEVRRKIEEVIDSLGGISKYIKNSDKVLLKPNFLRYKPVESAVTTHPLFIKALAEVVKDAGARVIIGDSPGIGSSFSIAKKIGLLSFIKKVDGKIIEFSESQTVKTPQNYLFRRFEIAKEVVDSDVIINVPKIKTHAQMYLTLAVKNLFGCVVGMKKTQWHFMAGRDTDYFATMLVELHKIVNPSLTIVDGITGMEGNGPGSGTPRNIGIVLGGEDCVAIDRVICEILKADVNKLRTLIMAERLGIGETKLDHIILDGDPLGSFDIKNFKMADFSALETMGLPKIFGRHFKNAFTRKPVIDGKLCVLCKTCIENCPSQVMSVKKGKRDSVEIDYRNCIRCFCCQELCPEGAIFVGKGWFLRIVDLFD